MKKEKKTMVLSATELVQVGVVKARVRAAAACSEGGTIE